MKRITAILLCLSLLVGLSGCFSQSGKLLDPVTFYYLRTELAYGEADSVIASEARESSGHEKDLYYLLALYLNGPIDAALYSPFPKDVRVVRIQQENDTLTILLNEAFGQLKGIQLTKACACLAMTCFSMAEADVVSILAENTTLNGAKTIEFTRDSLVLQEIDPGES